MMMEVDSRGRFRAAIAVLAVVAVASLVATTWFAAQLTGTQAELRALETELATAQSHLADFETGLAATSAELSASRELVESLEAALFDLEANYYRLTAGWGYVLRDPSYREMKEFLERDGTSGQDYMESQYTCVDFAADVKANAAKEGIRAAYVIIEFRGGGGHAIVAFDTTDRELIFVEPQFDWEVDLVVGMRYHQCVKPPPGQLMAEPDYDDTITRFVVVW
jgi:hypothetical protein